MKSPKITRCAVCNKELPSFAVHWVLGKPVCSTCETEALVRLIEALNSVKEGKEK